MPFKSKSQMRHFFAAEDRGELPKGTANRWAHHTKNISSLPEKKGADFRKGLSALLGYLTGKSTPISLRATMEGLKAKAVPVGQSARELMESIPASLSSLGGEAKQLGGKVLGQIRKRPVESTALALSGGVGAGNLLGSAGIGPLFGFQQGQKPQQSAVSSMARPPALGPGSSRVSEIVRRLRSRFGGAQKTSSAICKMRSGAVKLLDAELADSQSKLPEEKRAAVEAVRTSMRRGVSLPTAIRLATGVSAEKAAAISAKLIRRVTTKAAGLSSRHKAGNQQMGYTASSAMGAQPSSSLSGNMGSMTGSPAAGMKAMRTNLGY